MHCQPILPTYVTINGYQKFCFRPLIQYNCIRRQYLFMSYLNIFWTTKKSVIGKKFEDRLKVFKGLKTWIADI